MKKFNHASARPAPALNPLTIAIASVLMLAVAATSHAQQAPTAPGASGELQ